MDLLKAMELAGDSTMTYLTKKSPALLSAIGIGTFFTAGIWAVKATPVALECKREAEKEKGDELTPIETVKTCFKPYIPSVIMFGLGTGCVIESNRMYSKKITALATAASLSETALREYQEQMREVIGPKKEKHMREDIADKQIKNNPPSKEVIMLAQGEILCYEPISKKYFHSTINAIEQAKNNINSDLLNYNYVSVNDYLDQLGLDWEPDLDELGWKCYSKHDFLDISYGHKLADDYTPVLVIMLDRPPEYDYNKL